MVAYGHFCFSDGVALHVFRQLLAHVQKLHPQIKVFMTPAWETVSKWEMQEPSKHRPPMPEPIMLAMVSLALAWKWERWSAITLACFYSVSRVGELLKVRRREILTPRDLLHNEPVIYIRFLAPKSRRRGAKVQYSAIEESAVVTFLCKVWDCLHPDDLLYSGSQGAYRSRWNALLARLQISSQHQLTPGGLRGGGAVCLHRRGLALTELMWKMRLQHAQTLGYYLQETAALSLLPSLPHRVRHRIQVLQTLFPHFIK